MTKKNNFALKMMYSALKMTNSVFQVRRMTKKKADGKQHQLEASLGLWSQI